MPETTQIKSVSIVQAAEILHKSEHAVRQLLRRGKLSRAIEGRAIAIPLEEVLTYHARKKRLPSWEKNFDRVTKQTFVSLEMASATLMIQQIYLTNLVREKVIEGYITAAGRIMISEDSINAYLRNPKNDTNKTDDL